MKDMLGINFKRNYPMLAEINFLVLGHKISGFELV